MRPVTCIVFTISALFFVGCAAPEPPTPAVEPPAWAIAIHGGAGGLSPETPAEKQQAYLEGLEAALRDGADRLEAGATALEVVEAVIRRMEDDALFNAGRGAVFNHVGGHELDASIMDGSTLACGAVAGVSTVRHPITLARHVMEQTRHVLLAGDGAEQFADETGVERVDNEFFATPDRREAWQRARSRAASNGRGGDEKYGTVGVVALDREGRLAAGTSTGGLTNKKYGRVGDSPIIGAGTYANGRVAVSGTGVGEEYIRHSIARSVDTLMEHGGRTVGEAVAELIHERLEPGVGGLIALAADGTIAMDYNTSAMFRGAADAEGRFETAIWKE